MREASPLRRHWIKRYSFWLEDHLPVWLPLGWLRRLGCFLWGHLPIVDMCGQPEHDFCAWCMASMPGRGHGRRPPRLESSE